MTKTPQKKAGGGGKEFLFHLIVIILSVGIINFTCLLLGFKFNYLLYPIGIFSVVIVILFNKFVIEPLNKWLR